jgi:hypothetical protein
MNRLLRKIVTAATLILAAVAGFVAVKLNWDMRESRQLILDDAKLEQDHGSINLRDFLAQHRKSVHAIGDCKGEQCAYVADLRNEPLPLLHLAPPGEFYVSVINQQGHIQEVYISAKTAIAGKPYAATIRSVSENQCKEGCKAFSSDAVADASGRILVSAIELGPRATSVDRGTAFQINANCIFEIRGCNSPLQITGGWPIRAVE